MLLYPLFPRAERLLISIITWHRALVDPSTRHDIPVFAGAAVLRNDRESAGNPNFGADTRKTKIACFVLALLAACPQRQAPYGTNSA